MEPLEGLFALFQEIASGNAETSELRKDAFNDIIGDSEIDTCVAFDTHEWETGINRNETAWVIVEQYDNRESALEGHKKWIKTLKDNPVIELNDINLWNL